MYFTLFLTTIFHYIFYKDKSQLLKSEWLLFQIFTITENGYFRPYPASAEGTHQSGTPGIKA